MCARCSQADTTKFNLSQITNDLINEINEKFKEQPVKEHHHS